MLFCDAAVWFSIVLTIPYYSCFPSQARAIRNSDQSSIDSTGECWSGPPGSYDLNSFKKKDTCVSDDYKPCGKLDRICVGKRWTNFVFELGKKIKIRT